MGKMNNVIQSAHLRKHWNKWHYTGVRCFFNQKAHKQIRKDNRAAKAAEMFPRPLGKLRPIVMGQTRRYSSKVRIGRGFSLAELKEAGLTLAFAQTVGIACDHRRHNKNADTMAQNVKRLNDYKKKLILFPSKDRKNHVVKKGLIHDSTADKLKDVEQNVTPSVFGLPEKSTKLETVKIDKEMQSFQAYQKLRHERINKYYEGKRKRRAKLEEEKKK